MEKKIFRNKRFDTGMMEAYGFVKNGAFYVFEKDILDGELTAELMVPESGNIRGRVLDRFNGEEYVQLRMPNVTGAFVGSVREAYEGFLLDIAVNCCRDVAFSADQSNRIAAAILDKYSVEPDFPWEDGRNDSSGVFRHRGSRKWFGLIMEIDRRALDRKADKELIEVMNLKAEEDRIGFLHEQPGIYPAYHMNHSTWISVTLDDTLSDADVMKLIDESYVLTSAPASVLNDKIIRAVLDIADNIPPGKVISYGQIAALIGRPKNARLVGRIMSMADRYGEHPCHRVVNSAGRTVPGWTEQRDLLESEGVSFKANGNVDMKKHAIVME